MNYFSFLVCSHPTATNLYINGMPIGDIINDKFLPKTFKNSDGSVRQISFGDLKSGVPCKDLAELKRQLIEAIEKIEL